MLINQTFGNAVQALNEGKIVSREGWNGSGLFVFKQVPSVVPAEFVYKMSSLPPSVKETFIQRGGAITYKNQCCIVYPDNTLHGWSPSTADALAVDWIIQDSHVAPVEEAFDADTVGVGNPV